MPPISPAKRAFTTSAERRCKRVAGRRICFFGPLPILALHVSRSLSELHRAGRGGGNWARGDELRGCGFGRTHETDLPWEESFRLDRHAQLRRPPTPCGEFASATERRAKARDPFSRQSRTNGRLEMGLLDDANIMGAWPVFWATAQRICQFRALGNCIARLRSLLIHRLGGRLTYSIFR